MFHKPAFLNFLGQAANVLVFIGGHSSPHTAAIVGGTLAILQAVFPSVIKTNE